jgi:hypothetical protein
MDSLLESLEVSAAKVVSGENAKVFSWRSEKYPQEYENLRGDRVLASLNHLSVATDRWLEKPWSRGCRIWRR